MRYIVYEDCNGVARAARIPTAKPPWRDWEFLRMIPGEKGRTRTVEAADHFEAVHKATQEWRRMGLNAAAVMP